MIKTGINPPIYSRAYSTRGFTLIELLVVIVIVAILFSFTLLAVRTDSSEDRIKYEARRFNQLLTLAMDEAILKNTEYGIQFNPTSYRFLKYNHNTWSPISNDKQLRSRDLPHDIELELSIEEIDVIIGDSAESSDESDELDKNKPQVFLLSSEEITPEFSVRFFIPGVETSYNVQGFINGQHQVEISDF